MNEMKKLLRRGRPAALPLLALLLAACASTKADIKKTPQEMTLEAEQAAAKGRYEDAIAQWKKIKESYKTPELAATAELKIADLQYAAGNWIEAAAAYEDFRKLHPNHEQAGYALYRVGLSNWHQIEGIDRDQTAVKNAASSFESFLRLYPSSPFVPEAKEKLADTRTKMAQYEVYVGRFYLRTEKYDAAIRRLTGALAEYPHSGAGDEALLYLGTAYLRKGDKAKGKEAFEQLLKEYPNSPHLQEARRILAKEY